ncbi:MAG TPA: 6-bladed beta-propeller [Candidatus Aminicenantes bacterium]|nr:6-bladed beta-propeller [Candidatus Aminicenantes bacterium]HRY64429.1 6-bladed beta-propeller [Candidatus Aminicenantes bacterium]HRZ71342.1 6-bladed beta-propeller [Candidatus Aminicenantes bacterium]
MITKGRGFAAAAVPLVAAIVVFAGGAALAAAGPDVARWKAAEIERPDNPEEAAVLGRPLALAYGDGGRLYVADALDCAVKVFSRQGRYLRSVGRKGNGPGELVLPSGVAVSEGAIVVADKLGFRIQIYDDGGRARGGFKVPFPPDRVYALGGGRILVTANPTGKQPGERLLHAYDAAGREIWNGMEATRTADPISDAFRNMILVCPGELADVYVVRRSGDRTIRRFSGAGRPLGAIEVDERHAFKRLAVPSGRGLVGLEGFCWAAARDAGLFYLSAPDAVAGRDLGPGRTVSVVDGGGRLRAVIELACPVHRFLVAGGRLFAIDDEGDLRLFEVGR